MIRLVFKLYHVINAEGIVWSEKGTVVIQMTFCGTDRYVASLKCAVNVFVA